ncbi:hypothetical protein F0562_019344 [Nyssa sinensis]|uniref:Uncharacterized protein n=1 Tax=Nyssa sinensis TaxID=561372 RepID=A0A5J4ZC24_9ASTE|nr:hypothetical protein F0562_019344 [Nyssa sinensis]
MDGRQTSVSGKSVFGGHELGGFDCESEFRTADADRQISWVIEFLIPFDSVRFTKCLHRPAETFGFSAASRSSKIEKVQINFSAIEPSPGTRKLTYANIVKGIVSYNCKLI